MKHQDERAIEAGVDDVDKTKVMTKKEIRRDRAAAIFMRHYGEKMAMADCWYQVNPHASCSRKSAADQAWREVRWLTENYPLDFDGRLYAHNLGIDRVLAKLSELIDATTPLKVGEENDLTDSGKVRRKTYLFENVPELRTQLEVLKVLLALHGYGPGATRQPLADAGKSLKDVEVKESLPKTVEEAQERGIPITLIEHPPEISQEQWDADFKAYQEEKERRYAEEGRPW